MLRKGYIKINIIIVTKDVYENTLIWCLILNGLLVSLMCFVVFYAGSGGNNHAVDYYRETSYPLAVKLGTITPDGAGNQ